MQVWRLAWRKWSKANSWGLRRWLVGGYHAEHRSLWLLGETAFRISRIGNNGLVLRNKVRGLGYCSLRVWLLRMWLLRVRMWLLGKRSRHKGMWMERGLLRCRLVQLSRVARKQLQLWLPLLL